MHPSNPVYADIFPLSCLEKCIFVHKSVVNYQVVLENPEHLFKAFNISRSNKALEIYCAAQIFSIKN